MSAIAKRYARAALEAALGDKGDSKAADQLAVDLRAIASAYEGSEALQELLRNPGLKAQREATLGNILKSLKLSQLATNLVRVLASADRIGELSDVARETEALADARAGRLRATIRSAVKLSDEQTKRLSQALEKRLGRPVVLNTVVEADLIGGLVCQVGDLSFDSSLKRQLAILTERLGAQAH